MQMQRRTFLAGSAAALGSLAGGSLIVPESGNNQGTKMRFTLRRAKDRGHADHGWLDSWHTFSFADYHDPAHMGFRSLRVINQDRVQAGNGFPTHPHRDMEIFSYVLEGALQHKDSMGNGRVLKPGEIQLMSAGTGVSHSEFNPSRSDGLHFLQIWILPDQRGLKPGYTEWKPTTAQRSQPDVVVISPDGRDGSALIHQDVIVRRLLLPAGTNTNHEVAAGRGMWVQVVNGELQLGEQRLLAGDGASSDDAGSVRLQANKPVEALLFDLGPAPVR
ncbi:MAG TPA: pirin family protein [Planctomycetota bacterium]